MLYYRCLSRPVSCCNEFLIRVLASDDLRHTLVLASRDFIYV
jgi:hypothetical protein